MLAVIILRKEVPDVDKAGDFLAEVQEALVNIVGVTYDAKCTSPVPAPEPPE